MPDSLDLIARLTEQGLPAPARRRDLRQFAAVNGWHPSDELDEYPGTEQFANGHLIVEHGLAASAVITFLRVDSPYQRLQYQDQVQVLSISYNNMVDWHLFPDRQGLTLVYNRTTPAEARHVSILGNQDLWRVEAFERLSDARPSPTLKNLEEALIATISFWKRSLAAELNHEVPNDRFAAFFNAVIFARALEDQRRPGALDRGLLIEVWNGLQDAERNITNCVHTAVKQLGVTELPSSIFELNNRLATFDLVESATMEALLRDFYRNRYTPYQYDFSIISKQALSRIYERYVSLLRSEDSPQLQLFRSLPEEHGSQRLGAVYTPQYIARFFGRFLKEDLPPRRFRSLQVIDPACGSGIFLRTILEMQCDPFQSVNLGEVTREAFRRTTGIDIDPNACEASRLSLALLHLALTNEFPDSLQILNAEAIEYVTTNPQLKGTFDAVLANPPFIKWDNLQPAVQQRVAGYMQGASKGKIDIFLAMLKLGMDLVRPGGYLLYVLPHSFLIGRNAAQLRATILQDFNVRILADLSEIPVFEHVGSYVILLILQKKTVTDAEEKATLVRCRDFVGQALMHAIERRTASNSFFDVFEVDQEFFGDEPWLVLSPVETRLQRRLQDLPRISDYLNVKQGFITGNDEVFVRSVEDVSSQERRVWPPFLTDREMCSYAVPAKTRTLVFHPFEGSHRLDADALCERYPATWSYLEENRQQLETRNAVSKGQVPWWCPERPRTPESMLRAKIVTPELVLVPRFALDPTGRFAVSHGPFLTARDPVDELNLLRFFLPILNSSVTYWQIARHSHKYSRGYAKLQVKTLKELRVPDPTSIEPATMRAIQEITKRRLRTKSAPELDQQLEKLVAEIFEMTEDERRTVGTEVE